MIKINENNIVNGELSIREFAIILYYIEPGVPLNTHICEELWNKGFLVKTLEGYVISQSAKDKICEIKFNSNDDNAKNRYLNLADKLRLLFPEGKKQGTPYYWRDSKQIIAQKLESFIKKYGQYSDEEIISATQKYVETYKNDDRYMQLLKYFISKKDINTGEYKSELLSYIENKDIKSDDWLNEIK